MSEFILHAHGISTPSVTLVPENITVRVYSETCEISLARNATPEMANMSAVRIYKSDTAILNLFLDFNMFYPSENDTKRSYSYAGLWPKNNVQHFVNHYGSPVVNMENPTTIDGISKQEAIINNMISGQAIKSDGTPLLVIQNDQGISPPFKSMLLSQVFSKLKDEGFIGTISIFTCRGMSKEHVKEYQNIPKSMAHVLLPPNKKKAMLANIPGVGPEIGDRLTKCAQGLMKNSDRKNTLQYVKKLPGVGIPPGRTRSSSNSSSCVTLNPTIDFQGVMSRINCILKRPIRSNQNATRDLQEVLRQIGDEIESPNGTTIEKFSLYLQIFFCIKPKTSKNYTNLRAAHVGIDLHKISNVVKTARKVGYTVRNTDFEKELYNSMVKRMFASTVGKKGGSTKGLYKTGPKKGKLKKGYKYLKGGSIVKCI